jgi:single-stranded DNA-binding protein
MHSAQLLVEPLTGSKKIDQFSYETLVQFNARGTGDNTVQFPVYTNRPVPDRTKLMLVIGQLYFHNTLESLEFHAEFISPVIVTPDWPKNPWANQIGLVDPVNRIQIFNANLGSEDQFKIGSSKKGDPVFNTSVATRCGPRILQGHVESAKHTVWCNLAFWRGMAIQYMNRLSPGQRIQSLSGSLTFQVWGEHDDRLTVNINVTSIIPGKANAQPRDDAPAPTTEKDELPPDSAMTQADELPPEPAVVESIDEYQQAATVPNYDDIPM